MPALPMSRVYRRLGSRLTGGISNSTAPPKVQTPECGKLVKLSAHGTKVLSLIPNRFHLYNLKDIWPVFKLDLVS
jgi:hypothetical protein